MNYNFIGRLETFKDDLKLLAFKLNVPTDIINLDFDQINHHAGRSETATADWTTADWFKNISCHKMKIVYKLYEEDYKAFSYDIPQWLSNKIIC